MLLAHRIAWSDHFEEIPEGFVIHHRCGNRLCVNIEHLDCMSLADHSRLHGHPTKSICKWGHDLTVLDARTKDGACRQCRNRLVRANYYSGGKERRDARLGITARH